MWLRLKVQENFFETKRFTQALFFITSVWGFPNSKICGINMYQSCRFQCCVSDRDNLNNMVEKGGKEEITYLKWSSDVIYNETRNRKTLSYFNKHYHQLENIEICDFPSIEISKVLGEIGSAKTVRLSAQKKELAIYGDKGNQNYSRLKRRYRSHP
jgi:hypothetical protein